MGHSYNFHEYHFGFLPKNSYIFITHLHRGLPGSYSMHSSPASHQILWIAKAGYSKGYSMLDEFVDWLELVIQLWSRPEHQVLCFWSWSRQLLVLKMLEIISFCLDFSWGGVIVLKKGNIYIFLHKSFENLSCSRKQADLMGKPLLRRPSCGDASGFPGLLCLRGFDKLGFTIRNINSCLLYFFFSGRFLA
jgi:hypothetical protein